MDRLVVSSLLAGLSVLAYGLAAELYPRYHTYPPALSDISARRRLPSSLLRAISYHFLRIVYFIGVPYLALRLGVIPVNWMGLGGWTATEYDVLRTLALMLTVLVATVLTWRDFVHCEDSLSDRPMSNIPALEPLAGALEVVYLQVHWAFYRGAALVWTNGDYHAGIWSGFVVILLEEMLNPQVRRNLLRPSDAGVAVGIRWALAASSGVAFMLSRSLWLVALLHWAIELSSLAVRRELSRRRSPANRHITT